jgi:hypothetical protein
LLLDLVFDLVFADFRLAIAEEATPDLVRAELERRLPPSGHFTSTVRRLVIVSSSPAPGKRPQMLTE